MEETDDGRLRLRVGDVERGRSELARAMPGWELGLVEGEAFTLELHRLRLSSVQIGTVSFGAWAELAIDPGERFVVCSLLAGRVDLHDDGARRRLDPGTGIVGSPGTLPWRGTWAPGTRAVFLVLPAPVVEQELERLVGQPLTHRLRFEAELRSGRRGTRRWHDMMSMLVEELEAPIGLVTNAVARLHLERIVLDALLLGQPHTHSAAADDARPRQPRESVRKAIGLMQERPGESWTTSILARELFVSPRALQEGFQRDLGATPTGYLRQLRLRRVHDDLLAATPDHATVQAVAWTYGLFHLGRLAREYRAMFDELPSQTLARPPG